MEAEMKMSGKVKNSKKTWRQILEVLRPWRVNLLVTCVLMVLATVLTIFGPILLGEITTSATTTLMAGEGLDFGKIGGIVMTLIVLYIVAALLNYVSGVIIVRISAAMVKDFRGKIMEKISRLPMAYFDKVQYGDIMSRMTNDVETVAGELQSTVTTMITSVTTVIGVLVMMVYISVPLSVIAIVTVPLAMISAGKVMGKSQKHFKAQRMLLGKLNARIEEDYTGHAIIKINAHGEESLQEFGAVNEQLFGSSWKAQFYGSLAFPITHIFTNLGYVAICVVGGNLAIAGVIAIGNIQAFIQYVNRFNRPITEVAQIAATVQQILAAAERIFEFLEEPEESVEVETVALEGKVRGAVEFHKVNFSYDGEKEIIKDFSAKIEPGMQVAIVGPTGAGKTTIVNLLMRFYDPTSGYITIDGQPTREMARADVRKLFGMVLQDTWLFSGTIMENLRYGRAEATDEEVKKAVAAVGLKHFVESLPNGYNTMIDEDSDNISAGEKQLLTIARAMVALPPMMILDEATSNVDTRTEELIQEAFSKLTRGRTSFVIAHRLSTIRNADLILVMREGNIVEQGNHAKLLKQGGFYAELYNSQFAE